MRSACIFSANIDDKTSFVNDLTFVVQPGRLSIVALAARLVPDVVLDVILNKP
jgi:hypothetical protein